MDSNSKKDELQNPLSDTEVFIQNSDGSPEDLLFDLIVGTLQDIVLLPQFQQIQQNFVKSNYQIFQEKEQNKIQYTFVFNQYQQIVQKYILQKLAERVLNFDMAVFSKLLQSRASHIDQQLLQMLNSFVDFDIFKSMMLDYKKFYSNESKFEGLTVKGAIFKSL